MTSFTEQRSTYRSSMAGISIACESSSISTALRRIREASTSLQASFNIMLSPNETLVRHARHEGEETFTCDNCGEESSLGFRFTASDMDDSFCIFCARGRYDVDMENRSCLAYEPEEERLLYEYNKSPIRVLNRAHIATAGETVNNKTRLFGLEIEFECRSHRELVDILENGSSIGIFKADGSLDVNGAEFCTLPMTYRAAREKLKPATEALLGGGARAWFMGSCGLHIHVSRESASMVTWGKVERFFANEENDGFLNRIAGRRSNDYCLRDKEKNRSIKVALTKMRYSNTRFYALNFDTGGKPTVEFRLFRGNVAYDGIMRCVDFCDAILTWAKGQSMTSPMNHEDFVSWMQGKRKEYPFLLAFLNKGKPRPQKAKEIEQVVEAA